VVKFSVNGSNLVGSSELQWMLLGILLNRVDSLDSSKS